MEGILVRDINGIWYVRWSDTQFVDSLDILLSSCSNSLHYIKDNVHMVKPLEVNHLVNFKFFFDTVIENDFKYAKLVFPDVDKFNESIPNDVDENYEKDAIITSIYNIIFEQDTNNKKTCLKLSEEVYESIKNYYE